MGEIAMTAYETEQSEQNNTTGYKTIDMSILIDSVKAMDAKQGEGTIRQKIIDAYPTLRELMEEKNLTRQDLYEQFCMNYGDDVITQKTFFNYLTAGKVALAAKEKEMAKKKALKSDNV